MYLRPSENNTVATKIPVKKTDSRRSEFFNGLLDGAEKTGGFSCASNSRIRVGRQHGEFLLERWPLDDDCCAIPIRWC